MSTYYTNHIQVVKKDGEMESKDITKIKEVFLEFFKSNNAFEDFLLDVSSLFNKIDLESYTKVVTGKYPFFYVRRIDTSGLYFSFNEKYMNCLPYIATLKNHLEENFIYI